MCNEHFEETAGNSVVLLQTTRDLSSLLSNIVSHCITLYFGTLFTEPPLPLFKTPAKSSRSPFYPSRSTFQKTSCPVIKMYPHQGDTSCRTFLGGNCILHAVTDIMVCVQDFSDTSDFVLLSSDTYINPCTNRLC